MIIDLHIHTNISDGALSPKEVIDEAWKNGVSVISITDHDTIDSYTPELFSYAKSKNIELICGVEISSKNEKAGIHILGYNFDLNNKELKETLFGIKNSRHEYLHNVAKKLNELGYLVNVEKLDKIDSVTKAHIALDIVKNEKNNEKLMLDFGHIPNKGEFIEAIMNENCPAYVEKRTPTPKEVARVIRKAGGKVVLAHPVAYVYQDNFTDEDILKLVREMKPDGIEANYLFVDANGKIIDETDKWNKFAKENDLFVTVGTDFHRKEGVYKEIGFTNTDFKLEDEVIKEIIKNISL